MSDIDAALAARLRTERLERNWSMQELADRAGVSKAMIGRIEKGDASPTANLLAKLANALGLTLSKLLARTESDQRDHLAFDDQPVWTDPKTRYIRRSVSPAGTMGPELTEVTLPPDTTVHFDEPLHVVSSEQIVILDGELVYDGGQARVTLAKGDWFLTPASGARTFINRRQAPCRYLLVTQ